MTHTYQNFSVEVDADGVAILRLAVAGRSMNVYTFALGDELQTAALALAARPDVTGLVITSGKPGAFLAGGDLKDFVGVHERGLSPTQAGTQYSHGSRVLRQLETCGKPVAAAINGVALGGGLEIALACHHRVLVDDPKIVVGLPEVNVGLLPGGGGTQRLPRLIGIEKALPLLLTGRSLSGQEALQLGLVQQLLPADQALEAARQWVLAHPGAQAPWDVKGFRVPGGAGAQTANAMAVFGGAVAHWRRETQDNEPAPAAILSAVYEGSLLPFDRALALEAKYFGQLLAGPVARNLMRTQFVNRTAAQKLVARPQGEPHVPVRRLGVLGAGMMGAGIAQVAAAAGLDVVLLDSSAEAAAQGAARVEQAWAKDVRQGRCTPAQAQSRASRLQATHELQALAGCDFVIEAVFEDRAVKAELMQQAAAVLAERDSHFVWASNTSTLPITSLAGHWPQPGQVIGLHFFSPVPRMELVEVIVGEHTGPATLARALDLAAQLRKTPIVVRDSPGFYTSRIFCAYIDEGMALLAEGVAPALIENAARQAGFATGPLAVTDEVSLDLQWRVLRQAQADRLPEKFLRRHAQAVIERMNAQGRLGRKSGGGFHDFPAEGPKRLWPGLAEWFPLRAEQPTVAEVKARLLNILALEAARCVEEGVIRHAADADLGAVLGLGYPRWAGGTLSYIDTVGLARFVNDCDALATQQGERFRPSAWLRARAAAAATFHTPS